MKRAWRAWVLLTSRKERGTTLAVFRIAVALVMLTTLLSIVHSGVIDALWVGVEHGGVRPITSQFVLLELLGGAKPSVVRPLTAVACLLCGAMALGAGGRWTIFAAALAYRSLSTIGAGSGGYDNMIGNAVWLLFLSDSTTTLSVDCKRRTGSWQSDQTVSAWPRLLVIGQLCLLYVATGLQKTSASWTFADGYSALYWFLQDPTWIRFDQAWTGRLYPVTQAMTFVVWHFEVTAPVLLLILYFRTTAERPGRVRAWFNQRDLRLGWAAIGVSMHLGIAALLNMGPFSWISLAFYLCLWRPEEIERWLARARLSRRPQYSRSR